LPELAPAPLTGRLLRLLRACPSAALDKAIIPTVAAKSYRSAAHKSTKPLGQAAEMLSAKHDLRDLILTREPVRRLTARTEYAVRPEMEAEFVAANEASVVTDCRFRICEA
jgi:hypothetical protein